MEGKMTQEKLSTVVSMLEGRTKDKKKFRLEEAKLKLLLSDPGLEVSKELSLLNKGRVGDLVINLVEKVVVAPLLHRLLKK